MPPQQRTARRQGQESRAPQRRTARRQGQGAHRYEAHLSGLSKDGNNVLNPETRLLRGELLGGAPSKYLAAGALPSSGVCAAQTRGLTPCDGSHTQQHTNTISHSSGP